MPPLQTTGRDRRRGRPFAVALALAATAVPVLGLTAALSQQASQLRGPVSEVEVERQLSPAWTARERAAAGQDGTVTGSVGEPEYRVSGEARRTGLFDRRTVTGAATIEDLEPLEPATPAVAAPAPREEETRELTTGTVRVAPLADHDTDDLRRAGPESERAGAIEGLERAAEADPFAPVGIRMGTFDLFPSLEQGIGWTSNEPVTPGGESALYSQSTLRLRAVSDWSLHSAELSATGSYRRSISGAHISELEGAVDGRMRLELGHDFHSTLAAGYEIAPESARTPGALADVASRPNRHRLTGAVGLGKDEGPARLSGEASIRRDMYETARLTDGTTVSQRERNSTLGLLRLRAGYAVSPSLQPFVEGEFGRRLYDQRVDSEGFRRSSYRYGLRGGVAFDRGEKFSGEVAAGWLTERPDDDALSPISGLALEAALNWSPVRGTTLGFAGTTAVEATTVPGETGSILYSGTLTLSRDLRADLTGTAALGAEYRRYSGAGEHDLTLFGEASLTWWLNRHAGVTGRLRHEEFRSSAADRDARATSVFMGMRFQR